MWRMRISLIPFIIDCSHVRDPARVLSGGTAYAHYWRGSLSQNELATRISVRGPGGTV